VGGSGNPSEATAHGVVAGMKAALKHKGRTLKNAKIGSSLRVQSVVFVNQLMTGGDSVARVRHRGHVPVRGVVEGRRRDC